MIAAFSPRGTYIVLKPVPAFLLLAGVCRALARCCYPAVQTFLFTLCQVGVKGNIAKLVGTGQPKVREDRGREQRKMGSNDALVAPSGACPDRNYISSPWAVERARCRPRLCCLYGHTIYCRWFFAVCSPGDVFVR